jgi:hypothetical protein
MADAQRREDDSSYGRDRRDYRDDDRRRRSSRERYARSRSPRDSRRGHDRERPRSRDERRYERSSRDDDRRYERRSRGDDRRYERSSRGDDRRYERRSRSRGYERYERRSRSRGDDRRYARRSRSRGDRYERRSRSRGDERDDYYARPRSRDGYRDRHDPRAQPAAPAPPARPKSEIEVYLASLGMDNPALPSFIASMDDELAKDFVEKLIILSKFPKDIIKDLLDTVIRKRASIKNPSAWLVVSMKKEQPCNVYSMTGFCQHGDRCRFKHVEPP